MRRIESSKQNLFFFKINSPVLHHSTTPVVLFKKSLPPMILAFVFILTALFFSTVAAGQEPLSIKVGAYANHPKIFMDADGKVSRFWSDLIKDIAKKENWKIEYIWGTWSEGFDHLINKEIAVMPDVAFTEKRNKLYTFSEAPVLMSWTRVYVNKENTEIQTIRDLKNKKIAVLKETLKMLQAESKEALFANLARVFGDQSYEVFREQLISLAEGKYLFESEAVNHTLRNNEIHSGKLQFLAAMLTKH